MTFATRASASEWTPCRHSPFSFSVLDEISLGEIGRGRKYVSGGEIYSAAHFPSARVLPGIVIIGAVACIAAAMLGRSSALRIRRVRRFRFCLPVHPGDLLELEVRADGDRGFQAEARVAQRLVAHGALELEC